MLWSPILHRRGCPIRRSTDRCLFTAPRGLSQLVASFVGSWCQGIHLMLFFAWTSFVFSSYLLLWVSQIIFVLQWKSFFRCFLWSSAIFWRLNCSFLPDFFLRKTWFQNLLKNYLFVSISLFGFQWSFTFQQALACCWWAQVDSNHRPRAYQARALTCWAMSPFSLPMYLVHLFAIFFEAFASGGDDGIRTHDPLLAGQVLSQLSYTPILGI